MQALRTYISLLLLVCLTRTLLPEAWILALHPHGHTTAEPTHAQASERKGLELLSAQHQHCSIEQFYDVAYQPGVPIMVPAPRVFRRCDVALGPLAPQPAAGQKAGTPALRGPPCAA